MKKNNTDSDLADKIWEAQGGKKKPAKDLREKFGGIPTEPKRHEGYSFFKPSAAVEKPQTSITIEFEKFRKACQAHNTWFVSCTVRVCKPSICPFWKAMSK